MDCSPLGSSVHGISQTGILEWVAISFSRGSPALTGGIPPPPTHRWDPALVFLVAWPCSRCFVLFCFLVLGRRPRPCPAAAPCCCRPVSIGFSRQEYWSGLLCPPPGDQGIFSNPGIKAGSPALQVDYLPVQLPGKPPNGNQFSSVQFSRSVMPDSLPPHESQHARPPCPSPSPGVHLDSCPSSP